MMEILTLFKWPLTVLVFGLVFGITFLFIFRKPIDDFIRRTKKIGKDGVETEDASELQSKTVEAKPQKIQKLLDAFGSSIVLDEQEGLIKEDLSSRGITSEAEQLKVLTRHLAGTQILLSFERIHSLIFRSQIILLRKLNVGPGAGYSKEYVETHFKDVQELYPTQLGDWNLEQYLDYLYKRSLIIQKGEKYNITYLGVDYLTWLVKNGISENRPL